MQPNRQNKNLLITAILSTVVMVLYAWLVLGSVKEQILNHDMSQGSILDGHFGFNHESAEGILGHLSNQGLQAYWQMLTLWDTLFPLFYGFMYIAWLFLIFKTWQNRYKWARWIVFYPVLPVMADWFENYSIAQLVKEMIHQNRLTEASIKLASLSTQVKWSLSFINYLIIIVGIVALMFQRRKEIQSP